MGHRAGEDLTTFGKLVVGDRDLRIVYRLDPDEAVVEVWVIAHRANGEAYDLASAACVCTEIRPCWPTRLGPAQPPVPCRRRWLDHRLGVFSATLGRFCAETAITHAAITHAAEAHRSP